MINRISLAILTSFVMSFTFAQTDVNKVEKQKHEERKVEQQLKKNVAFAVDYFAESLKLDPKQTSMFSRLFTEYTRDVYKAREKAESKEVYNKYVMRFATRLNSQVESSLNDKQFKKYKESLNQFDRLTLAQKKGKDPRKK